LRVKDGLKSRAARERGLRDKGGCEGTGTEERASGQASERERESTSEQTNKQADVARAVWRRGREGQKASAEDEEREGEGERPSFPVALALSLSSPLSCSAEWARTRARFFLLSLLSLLLLLLAPPYLRAPEKYLPSLLHRCEIFMP